MRPPIETQVSIHWFELGVENGKWQGRLDLVVHLDQHPLTECFRLRNLLIVDGLVWPQVASMSFGQRSRGAHRKGCSWQLGPVLGAAVMEGILRHPKISGTRAVPKPKPGRLLFSKEGTLALGRQRASELGWEVD